ncbi:26S proteasome non-ATPase regulatory subunit 13-like isoform X2 [Asterias rubens]|uniref:26S proteasome non-ATPase regulatory subunit 13-like isoform X1 n=1 Tax=Asterias rubens TaxID=7604 RepID=UPI0014559871|nr:26S proteasome non-ATPase regulatory subunit 13-like isoform X1 [Asterias rubens]XP_033629622.1 26S proteasome non-ATPase regulatory subunit 13-like isoform X2 [Asterias rubens]
MKDISGFVNEQQRQSSPEIATEWTEMEEMYNKKLWHQLTVKLLTFVKDSSFAEGDGLIKLYENFLSDFEHRINPLSLTEMAIIIVKQIKEYPEALAYLDKIREKVKGNEEAVILCMTCSAMMKLGVNDLEGTKTLVEEAQEKLDNQDGITTVHGRFYNLSSNYYKLMGDYAKYYRDALRFLGVTKLEELGEGEKKERAFNLSLAALLGEGIYNFGELLAHPILEYLKTSEKKWLVDLLYAFNSGNLDQFESTSAVWKQQPDLAVSELPLRQKISLLCLMEMTFKRPADNRSISFEEIAREAKLPLNEVEILVMKALSLGLVKGSIDQVEQKVHMTWVQPRVLDLQQISTMQGKLQHWCLDVKNMQILLEDKAHDIIDRM